MATRRALRAEVTPSRPSRSTVLRLCTPVSEEGLVNRRWCKARRVAVADVSQGVISGWEEFEVGRNRLHDEGPHDAHHERMAVFLRDHKVNVIVVDHVGPCLGSTLFKIDIAVHPGASGEVRRARVDTAADQLSLRNEITDAEGECTCWLSAAQRAFGIRNAVSQAMLTHSVQSLARYPMVTAKVRKAIRTQFTAPRAEVTPGP